MCRPGLYWWAFLNWREIDLSWKVKDSNGVWHRFVIGVGYREDQSSDRWHCWKQLVTNQENTFRIGIAYAFRLGWNMSWMENEVSDFNDMFSELAKS